jgi:hypothetical protein
MPKQCLDFELHAFPTKHKFQAGVRSVHRQTNDRVKAEKIFDAN